VAFAGRFRLLSQTPPIAKEWNGGNRRKLSPPAAQGCGELIDPTHLAGTHDLSQARPGAAVPDELEQWAFVKSGWDLPTTEWLSCEWGARSSAKQTPRWCLDKIYGDTPLTRSCVTLGDLYLLVPFILRYPH